MASNAEQFRVNGSHASFQDLRFDLTHEGKSISMLSGLQELNYKRSIERGKERKNGSPFSDDVTTGEVSFEASTVWLREYWDIFQDKLTALGLGIFDVRGDLTITYYRKDKKLVTTVITSVMFQEDDASNKQGVEGLKNNVALDVVGRIYVNGQGVFSNDKLKTA